MVWRASLVIFVAGLLAGAVPAEEPPVPPSQGPIVLDDLPVEQRQRVRDLWGQVMCSCPRENWSRTLASCADACADPQKQEILEGVLAGRRDEEILKEQEDRYGPKALASPDPTGTGLWAYVIPFLLLALGIAVIAGVYRSLRAGPPVTARPSAAAEVNRAEREAVERELAEID